MTRLPPAFFQAPLAHRALHDVTDHRPENSRAAIRAAMARGYGIEMDLQLSHDGRAMVFHDYDMRRLTGEPGPIRQRSAAELARVPLLGGDEGIPGFAEVLALVAGQVPLLVELKDQHGQMGVTDGTLERAVATDLKGYSGDVALMSFNPNSVALLAELVPDRPRGIVTCDYPAEDWPLLREETRAHLRGVPDYDRAQASFISHEVIDLANPRVAALKAQGANVLCWTVTSPEQEAEARRIADNITFEGYLA
ncbi:phosphodiesterase [Roseovarius faecimaris]|uniref:Phosphodiesterase n=1 Tax=Roseovarius faecimaris TaxID=2494550 RepID=A0A6I6IS32_9RHOB|nr:glycerophosphodiester phosphodiesterase family protein [Roseovarius faecimaris]QGX99555.1 phosphodiesterase [Roseovarius faecimaris]